MLAVVLQSEGSHEMEFDGVYRIIVFTLHHSAKLEVPKMWENSPVFVCFLLGNSRASEFYVLTYRNTLFFLHRRIGIRLQRTVCRYTLP